MQLQKRLISSDCSWSLIFPLYKKEQKSCFHCHKGIFSNIGSKILASVIIYGLSGVCLQQTRRLFSDLGASSNSSGIDLQTDPFFDLKWNHSVCWRLKKYSLLIAFRNNPVIFWMHLSLLIQNVECIDHCIWIWGLTSRGWLVSHETSSFVQKCLSNLVTFDLGKISVHHQKDDIVQQFALFYLMSETWLS